MLNQFLWVIYPYVTITIFILGHIYKYNRDQIGWSARSSEIMEKRLLKWGSPLFHYGIIFAFFGHVAGILVPKSVYETLRVPDELYHLGAVAIGGVVGVMALIGLVILVIRRLTVSRIRLFTQRMDWFTEFVLLLVVFQGVYVTVIRNFLVGEFDYRSTVGPWFRSLFTFSPDPTLMRDVPLSFQIHILLAFLLFALWPFTRLVHLWSLPLEYLKRNYISYRSINFLRTFRLTKNKP
ncbi:respiratory nitrate reductase subunit gamma [Tepidibacillus decaturensis]|uniref:Nitrate reductase n=1 Tax=Tepidibacillus decaturensis TaxID=1413211 RepID=A0A135L7T8_9BACI|nr:respiratory nitrate reductase subunit gamma [Tepidibacillus decaturensis]KXG45040.1 nitrate reductase [Tepidibacillus decaturensis]